MDRYRVAHGIASFGPGQKLVLGPAQIAARRHNLAVPPAWDGVSDAEVEALAPLQFKAGEALGLPALDRRLEGQVVPVESAAAPAPEAGDKPAPVAARRR